MSAAVIDVGALHQVAGRLAQMMPAASDTGSDEDRAAIEAALDEAIAELVVIVE